MKVLDALGLIIPIGILVIAGVTIWVCLRELRRTPNWPTITAMATKLAREEDPDRPGRALPDLTVTYRYRDSTGQEQEGRGPLRVHKNVTVGGTVRVQVDPSDPRRSRPLAAPPVVFKGFIAFAVVLTLIGLVNLVSQVTDLVSS